MRSLQDIAADMEAMLARPPQTSGGHNDIEANHADGDDLLIEALMQCQRWASSKRSAEAITRLLAAYEALPKWYA